MIPLCFFQGLVYIPFTSFKIAIKFVHSESAFSYLPFCCCYLLGFASQWHKIKMCSFVTPLASGCHHISENYVYKLIGRSKTNACFLTHTFHLFSLKSVFLIQNTKILPSKASITRKSLPFFNYFVKILNFQALRFSRFIRFISCVCICLRECVRVSIKRFFLFAIFLLFPFSIVLIHRSYSIQIERSELTSFSPHRLLFEA